MDFSKDQQTQIQNLEKAGWPSQLAKTAVAAKSAGLESAIDDTAGFVRAMNKNEGVNQGMIESQKQQLRDQLQKLESSGDKSMATSQKMISVKRHLHALSGLK